MSGVSRVSAAPRVMKAFKSAAKQLRSRCDPFILLCVAHGLPMPETEVVFAPPRKFRADYLFRAAKVIVEQNGGIWTKGGHSSGRGILRDYEKANLAQREGFKYFSYTPQQLASGAAVEELKAVLR